MDNMFIAVGIHETVTSGNFVLQSFRLIDFLSYLTFSFLVPRMSQNLNYVIIYHLELLLELYALLGFVMGITVFKN